MKTTISKALKGFKDIIDVLNKMIEQYKEENSCLKQENKLLKEKLKSIEQLL
jgi:regulator of replication initiation timing